MVLSTVAHMTVAGSDTEAYFLTQYRIDAILLGALLAFVIAGVSRPSLPLVAAAALVLTVFAHPWTMPTFVGWGATAAAAAAAVAVVAVLGPIRTRPWLEHVGAISYGLYLFHSPVLTVLRYRFDAPMLVAALVTVLLTFALAEASWRFVEVPLRRRAVDRRTAVQEAVVAA